MNKKRERANSFLEKSDKIEDEDQVFNYKYYMNLIKRTDLSVDDFDKYKNITKQFHFSNNSVIRLSDNNYIRESKFQNIKLSPDCFTDDGELVDIFPSSREDSSIKINNIPKYYLDYIQIMLNILKLDKCLIYIYHLKEFNNSRQIRKSNIKLQENKYGVILQDNVDDIYWVLEHIQKVVINRNSSFNMRHISSINKKILGMDVEDYVTPKFKKRKIEYIGSDWIAASKTRNAALNDHCLDYFRAYNILDINDKPQKREFSFEPSSKYERIDKKPENAQSFIDFLLIKGNTFEDQIITNLKRKFANKFIKICDSQESRNISNYNKTLEEMKKGTPIIHQAVLYNYEHKVFGSADLLVRSDWLNKIINTEVISNKESKINAPLLGNSNYHYRVIDIKFSKLHLNTDSETIRNTNNVKPFKTQIAIYNMALSEMQGYKPDISYILGNGWVMNKIVNKKRITTKSTDPLNKLGKIKFEDRDKDYYDSALNAIDWIKDLNSSNNWTHDPPSNNKIYPNMCNTYDGIYHKVKKQIAEKYNEPTMLWNVGISNRNHAFSKNVFSWKDPKCTVDTLNITGDKRRKTIKNMLSFNQSNNKIINLGKIKHNLKNWRSKGLTIYVDFETIGSILLDSNTKSRINVEGDFIFMIGFGWQIPNSVKWNYECFYCDKINLSEENRIINLMTEKIKDLEDQYGSANIMHWSNAEPVFLNKANKRYGNTTFINWFDLLKFFKDNGILILGATNFSLKTIVKKMNEYGLINIDWKDSCSNGVDAMYYAWQSYINEDIEESDKFKEIIQYNEIDCKAMFEIVKYLRDKH